MRFNDLPRSWLQNLSVLSDSASIYTVGLWNTVYKIEAEYWLKYFLFAEFGSRYCVASDLIERRHLLLKESQFPLGHSETYFLLERDQRSAIVFKKTTP